jgi:Carbohydrate binding domain
MRIVALLLLSLTVSCTTNVTGLSGGGGYGGTTATGKGGGTNVGGAPGTAGTTGSAGTTGPAGTGSAGAAGSAGTTGSAGAAGSAGTGSSVGSGGRGLGGAGGGAGAGGAGGGQTGGQGGSGCCIVPPSDNGQACAQDADCKSSHCVDHTCCSTACAGACRSCANDTGTCTLAAAMTDPRDDCPAESPSSCGRVGSCNGSGACALAPAGTICSSTPTCDGMNASVIAGSMCNGAGACIPGVPASCHGYACTSGACQTTCSDDSACALGGFCSAQTCIVSPNLAGNGDLETGTLTGWTAFGGGGSLSLSAPASGYAHTGQFSVQASGRTQYYQGPSYELPTGLGRYAISAWAMQTQDTSASPDLLATIRLVCLATSSYLNVQMGGFGMSAPAGTWIHFAAEVDTKTIGQDCASDGLAGAVRSANLFFNQLPDSLPSPNAYPDVYVDDLVVQSTDGHNLIGNPNFEAGVIDGWSITGGASALTVSGAFAHGGQYSLRQAGRTVPTAAVTYALPIGAARYAVSLWVLQSGAMTHQLALLPLYSCVGSSAVHFAAPSAPVTAPPGQWSELTGTFVLPPADAPAGCVLSQASLAMGQAETGTCGSGVECPDLFVDDASITLK